MRTLTKILLGLFVFTLGTSSSNPRGQVKKPVLISTTEYKIIIDKSKLISKDKQIALSLDSLERKCKELIKLKKEVVSLRDSTQQ
jgi:hypothetical protein